MLRVQRRGKFVRAYPENQEFNAETRGREAAEKRQLLDFITLRHSVSALKMPECVNPKRTVMLHTFRTTLRQFAGVIILALLLACRPNAADAPRASATAQRYDLKGKVISVDKPQKRVTLEHEEIPGYMDAMTMPFAIRDGEMLGRPAGKGALAKPAGARGTERPL